MRKFIPIVLTLVVLVGAFVAYFAMQGKYGVHFANDSGKADNFPVSQDGNGIIKPGAGAWSKQFDKDGNLYYQFKCDFYDPQPDGTVKATHPVIQFFLSGGRVLQIEGENGTIQFAQGAQKGAMTSPPSDPPRNGELQHVTVKLFDSVAQQSAGDAEMTMTMQNAQFDDDTFRLFTEEYVDEAGKKHLADEIPVTVDSQDYSFRGSGLVLYWNDLDKQLKSLEIAHGDDLTLKNTNGFLANDSNSPSTPPVNNTPAPIAAAPAPATPAAPPLPGAAQPPRQRYTATFSDNVQIWQGDNSKITADRMDVDFAAKGDSTSAVNNASPATAPAAAGSAPDATQPATAAKTPAQVIHIKWSGKMTMAPTDATDAPPLPGGKAIVRLVGAPMKMHQVGEDGKQWVDLQCNQLEYHTDDSSAHLSGNVLLTQGKGNGPGSTVSGDNLEYSRVAHTAKFVGPGQTRFPDPNDPKSVLTSAWEKSCTVNLYDAGQNQTSIESADLEGNVVVDDAPRMHMTARDNLQLRFDRVDAAAAGGPDAPPPLRQISARGDADVVVEDANHQVRRIRGQHLELFRDPGPDGKLYAKTILCDGNVRAEADDQSLAAEDLRVDLIPAPPKTDSSNNAANNDANNLGAAGVALDRMIATENVVVMGKDGSSANADDLEVQMVEGQPHLTLYGSTEKPAVVRNKTSTMTGWTIRVSPHDQYAEIEGPGTFEGLQEPKDPNDKPRPVHLAWSRSALLDGKSNRVFVVGDVTGGSDDPDGSHQSATCGRIVATLVDVAPTTQPAATTKPSKAEAYGQGADFMKNKQIESVSLEAGPMEATATTEPSAQVESKLADADGNPLKQYDLLTHKSIDYNVSTKRLSVIGPGRILAVERTPPTTQPQGPEASSIGGQGATGIEWQKRFIYDDTQNSAIIEGNVTVVHEGLDAKSQTVTMHHADLIQAAFEPSAGPAPGPEPAAPKLTSVTATGNMTIVTTDKTIYCGELDFDPVAQTLTCSGGARGKVYIVDAKNLDSGSCTEAIFDMKNNELKKMTDLTGQGH